jgi:bifunctional non-homologous end joining protein LigD
MLQKGDLKFRLDGNKLKGDFALVHIKSRRPGSKGNEWLLIKHRDAYVVEGYDIDKYDRSAQTGRTMAQIAGDAGSAEWLNSRKVSATGRSTKNDWLADSIAKADAKKAKAAKKSPATASKTTPATRAAGAVKKNSHRRKELTA